jgi:hypothetical protein
MAFGCRISQSRTMPARGSALFPCFLSSEIRGLAEQRNHINGIAGRHFHSCVEEGEWRHAS